MADSTAKRPFIYNILQAAGFLCLVFLIASAFIASDDKERTSNLGEVNMREVNTSQTVHSTDCKNLCRPPGSEPLPRGIISGSTNLEMRPLWGSRVKKINPNSSKSLLAIAAGIKQKDTVNKIVEKFPESDFTIMLFHYDGFVDGWKDLPWSDSALHVSAVNQTKWWFAKRFLHPDVVAEYSYIFVWDEDLGVENFNASRYLSIVKKEGLEISQPALDPAKSQVHHPITVRGRKKVVHRRIYKFTGARRCYENSTAPPCTGWVEMMAPVFSKAAWRCAWYMIQNDLIHAWGLDLKLGYCSLGDRTKTVGVVDAEYVVHYGIPTLGGSDDSKTIAEAPSSSAKTKSKSDIGTKAMDNPRSAIRWQSFTELGTFRERWGKAVAEDECWRDPYPDPTMQAQ